MTALAFPRSLAPLRWARLLVAALVLLCGCAAPSAPLRTRGASLRIVLEAPATGYSLQYKANLDWRRAVATLTPPGGNALTSEANPGGALAFSSLAPGDGYSLTVALYRPSPEGPEVELGRLERATFQLVAGVNTLTAADLTPSLPRPVLPPAVALGGPFVSSLPESGPGAMFEAPNGVAVDAGGNVYVADTNNHRIRKITPDGLVTTLAGTGEYGTTDGLGPAAAFDSPSDVAVDASGTVYVADRGNARIRAITPQGLVSTLAGGTAGFLDDTGAAAQFNGPTGIAVDGSGNVYVADQNNHRIRRVTPAGVVTTLAGSTQGFAEGTGAAARFDGPADVAVDAAGNAYVADLWNHRLRKITPEGEVSTLAGSSQGYAEGTGAAASFNFPSGVVVDASGSVFVGDKNNHSIRKVSPAGEVSTVAGAGPWSPGDVDGTGLCCTSFDGPTGLAIDAAGTVYVADRSNNRVRKVSPIGVVTTLAGRSQGFADGIGGAQPFNQPSGVAIGATGTVYVVDRTNHRIRTISPSGLITTLAGSVSGFADGVGAAARFQWPQSIAVDAAGNAWVADTGNNRIRKVTPDGTVTTLASGFSGPNGVAVDASGTVYVADTWNLRIKTVSPEGVVTTLAGSTWGTADGTGAAAQFKAPMGITVDAGGIAYVTEYGSSLIRKVTPEGVVTTIAGSTWGTADGIGTAAQFAEPLGITVDEAGTLYVADTGSDRIRKVTASGVVSTLAGGTEGFADGPGDLARFDYPTGITIDASGTLYVSDHNNHLIRRIR